MCFRQDEVKSSGEASERPQDESGRGIIYILVSILHAEAHHPCLIHISAKLTHPFETCVVFSGPNQISFPNMTHSGRLLFLAS